MSLAMLPIKDLLRCERVSKAWCDLIRDGQNTSKTLFRYSKSTKKQKRPSKRKRFIERTWNTHRANHPTKTEALANCIVHPLLSRFIGLPRFCSIASFDSPNLPYVDRWSLLGTVNSRNRWPNPTASWRTMFMTWPPLTEIKFHVSYRLHDGRPYQRETKINKIYEPEGITLNHFFYALSSSAKRKSCPPSKSMVEWTRGWPEDWVTTMYRAVRFHIIPAIGVEDDELECTGGEAWLLWTMDALRTYQLLFCRYNHNV